MEYPSKQFKALLQISSLLDGYKLRNIDVLGNEDSSSNFTKFYHFLKTDTTRNEDLAAQHLGYPNSEDLNYRRFRVDFKTKLLHTIFFIDAAKPAFKERTQAYLRCSQQVTILDILRKFGYEDTVAIYGKEILEQSQKFELTEISLKMAAILRHIYAQKLKDRAAYEKYRDLTQQLETEYAIERKAEAYFDELMSFYIKTIDIQLEVFDLADSYCRELLPHLKTHHGLYLILSTYAIELIKFLSRLDYVSVVKVCDKAIATISAKPFNADSNKILFLNNKLLASTKLRQYEIARQTSTEVLRIAMEGNSAWFNSLERTIRLEFHQAKHEAAFELFKKGRKHKFFDTLTDTSKEDWLIIEAYMSLFEKMGFLPKGSVTFSLGKFLNTTPIAQADKAGRNVAVQILVVLHKIIDKNNDGLDNDIETLVRYRGRYMKGNQHARSYLFIRILKSVVEFEEQQIITDFFQLLLEEDYDFENPDHLMEVIPFHIFWGEYSSPLTT